MLLVIGHILLFSLLWSYELLWMCFQSSKLYMSLIQILVELLSKTFDVRQTNHDATGMYFLQDGFLLIVCSYEFMFLHFVLRSCMMFILGVLQAILTR